jgi:hypothetical protein
MKDMEMGRKRRVSVARVRVVLEQVIAAAEVLFGPGTGEEKEDWVVEQVNSRVDIPLIGEAGEEVIIRLLVKLIVSVLNDQNILTNFSNSAGFSDE